ncbi:hypothetical protein BHE74_00016035 [Ensete ventricosum]|nr:hypothetical protein BHE74_00016035 [Ensete ventricosum]
MLDSTIIGPIILSPPQESFSLFLYRARLHGSCWGLSRDEKDLREAFDLLRYSARRSFDLGVVGLWRLAATDDGREARLEHNLTDDGREARLGHDRINDGREARLGHDWTNDGREARLGHDWTDNGRGTRLGHDWTNDDREARLGHDRTDNGRGARLGFLPVESNMAGNVASASRPRHDSATSTQRLPFDLTSGYPLTALRPTNRPPTNGRRNRINVPDLPPQPPTIGVLG